jgi:uncharacterized MAPEG superfamily protein
MLTAAQALVFSALLCWLMIMTSSALRSRSWTAHGLVYSFGNRENPPEPSPVAARADRAARNMVENMPLFLAVLLAAHWTGSSPSIVALGATIFFWSRVVYWPLYLAGVPYVRSIAWGSSLLGLGVIGAAALA